MGAEDPEAEAEVTRGKNLKNGFSIQDFFVIAGAPPAATATATATAAASFPRCETEKVRF